MKENSNSDPIIVREFSLYGNAALYRCHGSILIWH
jgi:hypothetical protein